MEQSIDQDVASAYWMLDILWVVKAYATDTNNTFSMIEQTMPYGSGPPPHYHQDMDEMFYILEGELTIWLDGKIPKIGKSAYA